MFRTFQFAAFRYESQINPKKELQSVGQMSLTFLFGTILKHENELKPKPIVGQRIQTMQLCR